MLSGTVSAFTGAMASRLIQGALTIWVLTLPISPHNAHVPEIILLLAAFAIILPMSGVYAHIFGEEIDHRRQTPLGRTGEIIRETLPLGVPALPPLFIFTLAWAGALDVGTTIWLSDISLLAIVFFIGFLAGKSIGGLRRGLLDGLLATVIAVILGLLRWVVT